MPDYNRGKKIKIYKILFIFYYCIYYKTFNTSFLKIIIYLFVLGDFILIISYLRIIFCDAGAIIINLVSAHTSN